MTSNRFYIQKEQIKIPYAVLTGDEHHHLTRVVRKKKGDKVFLFTRKGENFLARIEKIEKSKTHLLILEKTQRKESNVKIILAPSLIKTKALELMLQKSTELGIFSFSPLITERCVINISDKLEKKLNRWNRIVLEASKQCRRPSPPKVEKPVSLNNFIDKKNGDIKLFLDEKGGIYLKDFIFISQDSKYKPSQSVIILLGPEGGWTEKEKQDIVQHGYKAVSLGSNVLRAETAAIACVSIVSHVFL